MSCFSMKVDKAMQKVGNVVYNKGGNQRDQNAWEIIKTHINYLEKKYKELSTPRGFE